MMSGFTSGRPVYEKMKATVLAIDVDGKDLSNKSEASTSEWSKINNLVEAKVKKIIDGLKASHSKFVDSDFGPTAADDLGAKSLYGTAVPAPAGSKYPRPEDLRWDRPIYDDNYFADKADGDKDDDGSEDDEGDEDEDDEDDEFNFGLFPGNDSGEDVWCKHGNLFVDGTASGDVIQGQLGDCWFLGALAVMGAHEDLLRGCIWKEDSFKNYGLFVVRFFKDCHLIYVIIDDRLPVKRKDGKFIFARCKDPNELWVPMLEKAYAKLHGCYKSLIGGYSHVALADMTGYCPKLLTMKPGYLGFTEEITRDDLWNTLQRYKEWGCLLGTSIQANPKADQKVEAEAGMGLRMGHAYSFLDIGMIEDGDASEADKDGKVRLVRLRNPWGRGEWEGPYSDDSEERERIEEEIQTKFKKDINLDDHEDLGMNRMDGSFFMSFNDWYDRFTSLFVALKFPVNWCGKRTKGNWNGESGGNREMGSWISNPKFKFTFNNRQKGVYKRVFIGLYTRDPRLVRGFDYCDDPLYATALAFDVITSPYFDRKASDRELIPSSKKGVDDGVKAEKASQASYNFGSTQIECFLDSGEDFYIIPFLYKRGQAGDYFITVYAEDDFSLEGGHKIEGEQDLMVIGGGEVPAAVSAAVIKDQEGSSKEVKQIEGAQPAEVVEVVENDSGAKEVATKQRVLNISRAQFYEKSERLRERFVSEAKRLQISINTIKNLFIIDSTTKQAKNLSYGEFKRRLMNIGFSLTDLPDEDLLVLDQDNSKDISPGEFLEFFQAGIDFAEGENLPVPPPPATDDLIFKATDLEGVLNVNVQTGRELREPAAWFSPSEDGKGERSEGSVRTRSILQKYDPASEKLFSSVHDAINFKQGVQEVKDQEKENKSGNEDANGELVSPMDRPLKSRKDTLDDGKSGRQSNMPTVTEIGKKAREASGIQLHSDAELVEAEHIRAQKLKELRDRMSKNSHGAHASVVKYGALRKMEKTQTKIDRRDIKKDLQAMYLLNREPMKVYNIIPYVRPAALAVNDVDKDSDLLTSIQFHGPADIWDELIERVIVITGSRLGARGTDISLRSHLEKIKSTDRQDPRKGVPKHSFVELTDSKVVSKIPTPRTTGNKSASLKKGNAPVPKTLKKFSGQLSVTLSKQLQSTRDQQGSSGGASNIAHATIDKLIADEQPSDAFSEVYRRLIKVPVMSANEFEGDRSRHGTDNTVTSTYLAAFARRLFSKFDKNMNGAITIDEFRSSIKDMGIEMTEDDSATLFRRFETRKRDGSIDWNEFLDFFHRKIVSDLITDLDSDGYELLNHSRPLHELLHEVCKRMSVVIEKMMQQKCKSIDKYLCSTNINAPFSSSDGAISDLPDNAIFQNLFSSQVSRNVQILRQLKIIVSESDMSRISRAFNYNVRDFMRFVRMYKNMNIKETLDGVHTRIISGLEGKIGISSAASSGSSRRVTSESINKLWSMLCPSSDSLRFQDMVKYIDEILKESFPVTVPVADHTKSSASLTVPLVEHGEDNDYEHEHIALKILSRFAADHICQSSWNKSSDAADPSQGYQRISYSAFEAYVRMGHVDAIENKLKYLLQLELSIAGPSVHSLVHVYLNKKQDEAVVLVYEPLNGDVYNLVINENMNFLPSRDTLINAYKDARERGSDTLREYLQGTDGWKDNENLSACWLYNPKDTPLADATIEAMISRLRIVRGTSTDPNRLVLAEDPRLVNQLNTLLDATTNLPFFCTCNDTSLYFETGQDSLGADTSGLRRLVFGAIREHKHLHSFLTNTVSTLNVIVTSYNSGVRMVLSWREMLAHLTDYRNPFVTVQLKPRFLKPHQYVYRPRDKLIAFEGSEDHDILAVQRSQVVMDGGSHPSFDANFNIRFRPPKLTMCKLLCTDIHKMSIEGTYKYVILMVREAKMNPKTDNTEDEEDEEEFEADERAKFNEARRETFRFITIYDPRSATDYQCGVGEDCKLHTALDVTSEESACDLNTFMSYLADAIDESKIILGPAITPRLIVKVLNQRGKMEELLGQCEMSISAVLSGSGVGKPQWTTLAYTVEKGDTGEEIQTGAGELQVELGFRKMQEINDEIEGEKNRKLRKQREMKMIESKDTTTKDAKALFAPTAPVATTTATKRVESAPDNKRKKGEADDKEARLLNKELDKVKSESNQVKAQLKDHMNYITELELKLKQQQTLLMSEKESRAREASAVGESKSEESSATPVVDESVRQELTSALSDIENKDKMIEDLQKQLLEQKEKEMVKQKKTESSEAPVAKADTKKSQSKGKKDVKDSKGQSKEKQGVEDVESQMLVINQQMKQLAEKNKAIEKLQRQLKEKESALEKMERGIDANTQGREVEDTKHKLSVVEPQLETIKSENSKLKSLLEQKESQLIKLNKSLLDENGRSSRDPSPARIDVRQNKLDEQKRREDEKLKRENDEQLHKEDIAKMSISGSGGGAAGDLKPESGKDKKDASINWDTYELPKYWSRIWSKEYQMYYYADHKNKKTQWKHPLYAKGKKSATR